MDLGGNFFMWYVKKCTGVWQMNTKMVNNVNITLYGYNYCKYYATGVYTLDIIVIIYNVYE